MNETEGIPREVFVEARGHVLQLATDDCRCPECTEARVKMVARAIVAERLAGAAYLDGMADNARNHGYVDATSFHKAYEQGVREAAEALRGRAHG